VVLKIKVNASVEGMISSNDDISTDPMKVFAVNNRQFHHGGRRKILISLEDGFHCGTWAVGLWKASQLSTVFHD
jgi:hypothetical protein